MGFLKRLILIIFSLVSIIFLFYIFYTQVVQPIAFPGTKPPFTIYDIPGFSK
jgi:hypothetical protein